MGSDQSDSSQPPQTTTVAEALALALRHHEAGDSEQAEAIYQQILAAHPQHVDALHLSGVLALQSGRCQLAARLLERAITGNPDFAEAHYNLANTLRELEQYEDAVAAYQRALELKPDFVEAHINLASILHDLGRLDEAEASYRRAIGVQPNVPEAHCNLGLVLGAQGDFEAAKASFCKTAEIAPDFAAGYVNMANLQRQLGQPDEALATLREGVARNSESAELYFYLANLLVDADQGDTPLAALREAILTHGDVRAGEWYEEAIAAYRATLALRPDFAEAHNNLGNALQLADRYHEAIEAHKRAIELDASFAEAHCNIANALKSVGRTDDAIEHCHQAIALRPDFGAAYYNLATIHGKARCQEPAINALESWLSYEPDNAIATHMHAALTGRTVPERAADDYVRLIFDSFAKSFDQRLTNLRYRAPDLVAQALAGEELKPDKSLDVLDIGCGTGLSGLALRPYAKRLVGVDLSQGMLTKARQRECYDELTEAELTQFLSGQNQAYDLIAAVDTLTYFGALESVFTGIAGALRDQGRLIFTVKQAQETDDGFQILISGRYCHGAAYLQRVMAEAGLTLTSSFSAELRREFGEPVLGYVIAARKLRG